MLQSASYHLDFLVDWQAVDMLQSASYHLDFLVDHMIIICNRPCIVHNWAMIRTDQPY